MPSPRSETVAPAPAIPGLTLPARAEIEESIAPYVARRMPRTSAEWRAISGRVARKERWRHLRWRLWQWLPSPRQARPQSLVSHEYERHWSKLPWPRPWDPSSGDEGAPFVWGEEGLMLRRYGRKRPHHLLFARVMAALRPATALEVGFGNGINLLTMSALFPHVAWTGIELTEAGVVAAKSMQTEAELPAVLRDFAPAAVVDATAHRRIHFQQGDATKLPFPDQSFDLVFTFQALEQMQAVRDQAVKEISRVARRHVVLTEPLGDFNREPTQRHYMRARGYLDLSTADLPAFGLRPLLVFGDMPQRITLGVGLAVCERRP